MPRAVDRQASGCVETPVFVIWGAQPVRITRKEFLVQQITAQDSGKVIFYTQTNYRNIIMKHDLKYVLMAIIWKNHSLRDTN